MNTYLAADMGGTKLLIGEVSAAGDILRQKRYPSGYKNQREAVGGILAALGDYAATVGYVGAPVAAGLAITGLVDHDNGIWVSLDHTAGDPQPLAALLADKLGLPAAIDNDVRSATAAEQRFGLGRVSGNFIYLNVGTGIAAGFVVGGRILRGANCNAGEVGHTVPDYGSDVPCVCGRRGCVEAIAAGYGLTARSRALAAKYPGTLLTIPAQGGAVNVGEIFRLADAGDALCVRLIEDAADALACTIMNLVRTTDPDAVVLGGGIVADGWMLRKILPRMTHSAIRGLRHGIVLSALDPQKVSLIGAAAVAAGAANYPGT